MLDSRDTKLLHWKVQELLEQLIINCKARGVQFKVISTVRDLEYQAYIYEQGRSRKGNIVTNVKKPSFHWEKVGLAFDVVPVVNGKIDWNANKEYEIIGQEAKKLGFTWGGYWKSFVDKPHIQLDGGLTSSQILAGQRPSWFNDKPTKIDSFRVNLDKLFNLKIISNANSWNTWLKEEEIKGDLIGYLLINFTNHKTSKKNSLEDSVKYCFNQKIITDMNFYLEKCKEKSNIRSEWVKIVINRMIAKL